MSHIRSLADPDGSAAGPWDGDGPDPRRQLYLRGGFDGLGDLDATLDAVTAERLRVLLDALEQPDPADTPAGRRRSAAQRRHDAFDRLLGLAGRLPGLPSLQDAPPQVLVMIDLPGLLGVDPDQAAATAARQESTRADGADAHAADGEAPAAAPGDPDRLAERLLADLLAVGGPPGGPTPPAGRPPWEAAAAAAGPYGRLGSGVPLPAGRVRRLLADATVRAVLTLGPWRAVNVGAKHRTLPAWLRAVLTACRGPDCDRPAAWTQEHHISPWQAHKVTDLNDSLPLCAAHHDLITSHGWTAALDHAIGVVTWTRPDGHTIPVRPAITRPWAA